MSERTGVLVKFTAHPEQADALARHLTRTAALASAEPGTETWLVHRSPEERDVVWLYEVYANAAARDAHEASEGYQQARETTRTLMAGPPEVFPLSEIAGKGLPVP